MGRLKNIAATACSVCNECTATPCIAGKPVISSSGSAGGTTGSAFSYSIVASNTPTSYSIVSGSLPAGLSLNAGTGVISGTPSATGSTVVTIGATNACGTGTKSLTITISAPPCSPGVPYITSSLTSTADVGSAWSYTITGGNSPSGFSASGLPGWASLAGAVISGTPSSTAGSPINITIGVSNACGTDSQTLVLTITDCPDPTLVCDSIAASKTKCGYPQYAGYESTPPKIFLSREWGGSVTEYVYNGADCSLSPDETNVSTYGGTCSYSRPACTESGGLTVNGVDIGCGTFMGATHVPCAAVECPGVVTDWGFFQRKDFTPDSACYSSFPAHLFTTGGTAPFEGIYDEYTTAQLISDTVAALPSYPGTWAGDCEAFRDLEADELTYSIQRFKYKFTLPSMTGITTFGITWMEGSTPRSYTWNGTDTETPEYEVTEPGSNGNITITDIVATCT